MTVTTMAPVIELDDHRTEPDPHACIGCQLAFLRDDLATALAANPLLVDADVVRDALDRIRATLDGMQA